MSPEVRNLFERARECRSITEMSRKYQREYKRLRELGLLDAAFAHAPRKVRRPYSADEIRKIALRFRTRDDWRANHSPSYIAARKLGPEFFETIAPPSQRGKRSK